MYDKLFSLKSQVPEEKHCLPKAFSYLDLGSIHAFLLGGGLVQIGAGPPKRMTKKGWVMQKCLCRKEWVTNMET